MTKSQYDINIVQRGFNRWFPIAVIIAVMAGLIALLFLIPAGNADAKTEATPRRTAVAVDYGSGFWSGTTSPVVRTGDPATADVTLVGDSIGNRCTPDIRAALLAEGKTLATITQSGQTTQGLVDLLVAEPAIGGKLAMEAGTNDVFEPPAMLAQISRVKAYAAAKGAELYWGDTYVGRTATLGADARNSGWVNSFVYSAVPYDHVIQWQPALGYAIGRGRALSYYLQDGVHPWTDAGTGHGDGCAFLAAVYAGAL